MTPPHSCSDDADTGADDTAVSIAVGNAVREVRARIAAAARRAGRDPASITLVAATKTTPVTVVRAVLAAGVLDVGENRAQELLAKAPGCVDLPRGGTSSGSCNATRCGPSHRT